MNREWRTDDFDYPLPTELIASRPAARRDASRMLVLDREHGTIEHARFGDLPALIPDGRLCVLNNTRVVPARFFSDDGRAELLRVDTPGPGLWRCLVRPGRKLRPGATVTVAGLTGEITGIIDEDGSRLVRWPEGEPDPDRHGHLALPSYMGRQEEAADRERYQTVYASEAGAVAAPTAGLHFTPEILARLDTAFLTLHVGVGTFRPVKAEHPADHVMHTERFHVSPEAADRINRAAGVLAVGTTVVRVLEHLAARHEGHIPAGAGETNIFIHPPYAFRRVGSLLTNFHLPKSTLLMLVSAFAGRDFVLEAYAEAVARRYRFFSYGDCMLIL